MPKITLSLVVCFLMSSSSIISRLVAQVCESSHLADIRLWVSRVELGIEHIFLLLLTHRGRSALYCNKREKAQGVLRPHQHNTFIKLSNTNNWLLKSARNCYSHSHKTSTNALEWLIKVITSTTELSIIRSSRLRETYCPLLTSYVCSWQFGWLIILWET